MPGLSLRGGATLSGASPAVQATATATAAAFSPGATINVTAKVSPLSPKTGFGLAFWGGVVAVVLLIAIRQSLPR